MGKVGTAMRQLGEPWVIAETEAGRDEVAERSLRREGYRVYLPRRRVVLYPHGNNRRATAIMRVLLPGYIFVQDWRGWPKNALQGTRGTLVKFGSQIASISALEINQFRQREDAGDFDDLLPGHKCDHLKIGSKVRAFDGPFAGFDLLLSELSDNGRAIVKLMVFDRPTSVDIDARNLEVV